MQNRFNGARALAAACLVLGLAARPAPAQQGGAGGLDDLARAALSKIDGELRVPGLKAPVEVLRDRWGVPHIYARNLDDLFFAQGYVQAQDRLWQMEMWRRMGEGRVAEIVGPSGVAHDRMARMLKFRGPYDATEWTSYHPEGERIFRAFTSGINAYIAESADNLPVEFKLTGLRPTPWTPDIPTLRAVSAFGAARGELTLARQVAQLGAAEVNRRADPDPWRELVVPSGLDVSAIPQEAIDALAVPRLGDFPRVALLPDFQRLTASEDLGAKENSPGSNNWVVSGRMTYSGKPLLTNDPHRQVTNPSLRYIVHLNAPGWNVIGATEPAFPGVAIGHNGQIAWGLTIVGTDQADVFVEEVNPANPNEVRYNGAWEPLRVVRETIAVKGESPREVELKFSRHGPVFYEDTRNHRAYVIRHTGQEPGTGAYIGALRLNQTADCRTFLEHTLKYYKMPTENMICGDTGGNIAWRPSALSPNRRGWDGRLPVPGTGAFEWDGFRTDLPSEYNPERGYIVTANHDIHPRGWTAAPLFFKSGGRYPRFERLDDLLSDSAGFTVKDFERMQHDAYSAAAARDVAFFGEWTGSTPEVERARAMIAGWNGVYDKGSAAAALYSHWRRLAPESVTDPATPMAVRVDKAQGVLAAALDAMKSSQGSDWAQWRWGRIHRSEYPHPLVSAFDVPAVERTGGAGTVAATGATYREIIDFADFDRSMATITPGQSAQPGSPFYGSLAEMHGRAEYFPLSYSRPAVEAATTHRLTLRPAGR